MHVVWNINEVHEIVFMVLKPLNLQSYKIEKPPKNEECFSLNSTVMITLFASVFVEQRRHIGRESTIFLCQNVNVYCQHGPDVVVET